MQVRQGLKTFSNWPTFPQLYVNGEFIGGLDIVKVGSRLVLVGGCGWVGERENEILFVAIKRSFVLKGQQTVSRDKLLLVIIGVYSILGISNIRCLLDAAQGALSRMLSPLLILALSHVFILCIAILPPGCTGDEGEW